MSARPKGAGPMGFNGVYKSGRAENKNNHQGIFCSMDALDALESLGKPSNDCCFYQYWSEGVDD